MWRLQICLLGDFFFNWRKCENKVSSDVNKTWTFLLLFFFFPRKKKHRPLTRPGKGLEFFSIKILFALCDRNNPRGHSALLTWWVIRYKRFFWQTQAGHIIKRRTHLFCGIFEHTFFLVHIVKSDFHQKALSFYQDSLRNFIISLRNHIISPRFPRDLFIYLLGFSQKSTFCQVYRSLLLTLRFLPQKSFYLSGFQRKHLSLRFSIQTYLF